MILENSVKIKNYKCFGAEEQGFDKIFPLNVIIGKNNSGKSSLLDLIGYVINPTEIFLTIGRDRILSEVIIGDKVSQKYVEKSFSKDTSAGGIPGQSHYHYGLTLTGQQIKYRLEPKKKEIFHWDTLPRPEASQYIDRMKDALMVPLHGKKFLRITAERDILPEGADYAKAQIQANGVGATNLIRHVVNHADQNINLVRRDLLDALNEITFPDIQYNNIAPRERNGSWEIHLEDKNGTLIPLSKMGSGIKTILLVLINLLLVPEIEGFTKASLVYGFEELENNLHPSIQRRLLNFISDFCRRHGSYFFITTHSSIVIDLFDQFADAQILHVINTGNSSVVKTIDTHTDGRKILRDMDFRASDLLMTNGIVWVEGPSDVIYLQFLLELFVQTQGTVNKRKLNFSIQALSTAIWKYAGFEDFDWENVNEEIENKIISLEKLNINQLLIIDRDNNYENKKPSAWEQFSNGTGRNKARLIYELMKFCGHEEESLINNFGETESGLFFWINDGTLETYLEHFITTKGKDKFGQYFALSKNRGYFEKRREGKNSSKSKVELALEICKFCVDNRLTLEDLAPADSPLYIKLKKLYQTIVSWN